MEPEVRERFERIEAILQDVAERQKAAEQRMEQLDQKWEQRMEQLDQKWEQRMAKADARWDKRFESTRKLVEAGIGIVNRLGRRQGELERAHKAFLDSFRKGDANGRKRG